MTKEEAIELFKDVEVLVFRDVKQKYFHEDIEEAFKLAIGALEQQPCNDCISRQAMIEYIKACGAELSHDIENESVREDILNMPPVTPTQKWISVSEKLPKPNRLVNCYISTGATETYFIALWNDKQEDWEEGIGGYRLLKRDLGYEVLAWQPLPKPYEEKPVEEMKIRPWE